MRGRLNSNYSDNKSNYRSIDSNGPAFDVNSFDNDDDFDNMNPQESSPIRLTKNKSLVSILQR